jgi:hypothetical protein
MKVLILTVALGLTILSVSIRSSDVSAHKPPWGRHDHQQAVSTGGCNNSLAVFTEVHVAGYNQYGSYAVWRRGGLTTCWIRTDGWWWQNGRGVRIALRHQDGSWSCKTHYSTSNVWWDWNTVEVFQRFDDGRSWSPCV